MTDEDFSMQITERQANKFAKALKKEFKSRIDYYVRCCFAAVNQPCTEEVIHEESTRIMMRAAMFTYMKASAKMLQEEIDEVISKRLLTAYNQKSLWLEDKFDFIDYNFFNEKVYWYWVSKKLSIFMGAMNDMAGFNKQES